MIKAKRVLTPVEGDSRPSLRVSAWDPEKKVAVEEYHTDPVQHPTAPSHIDGFAVVTCRFDFTGYATPARNTTRFLRDMDRCGIPVYGIEVVSPGGFFLTEGNPRWKHIPVDDRYAMWQKEAAINAVVRSLPPGVTTVAVVDADISFDDPAWFARATEALNRYPAVQPFSEAVWTDQLGRVETTRPPAAGAENHQPDSWWRHPGFAWVITRDFWEQGPGFYPYCLTGAGDVVLYVGLACTSNGELPAHRVGESNLPLARKWHADVRRWMQGRRVAALPGRIWHEWHGDRADRRYEERHRVFADINISRDIEHDSNGLLRWTEAAAPGVRATLAAYFSQRKEDG